MERERLINIAKEVVNKIKSLDADEIMAAIFVMEAIQSERLRVLNQVEEHLKDADHRICVELLSQTGRESLLRVALMETLQTIHRLK